MQTNLLYQKGNKSLPVDSGVGEKEMDYIEAQGTFVFDECVIILVVVMISQFICMSKLMKFKFI